MASITIEPAPQVPLLEWNPQQYPEADSRRLIVRNPREVASLILGVAAKDVPESIDSAANMDQLFQQIQELVFDYTKIGSTSGRSHLSGFGYNGEIPTCPEDVWTSYVQKHPCGAKFRKHRLAHYDKLDELYCAATATGAHARKAASMVYSPTKKVNRTPSA
ncbi:hypothetical protein FN846DRAFT_915278 [Sphaerosporella brunnea]|uniref:Uncharacterized protein n=1 Tax=Sphaerosporella brunnea TaxID=1250544 RepID=A0A5J5EAW5_9PEZI|nr:hypothetical protein FN846DRAFT_915278 [Sphaerosporella brunnea]